MSKGFSSGNSTLLLIPFSTVKKHKSEKDGWIILSDYVYNITEFLNIHPGGKSILLSSLGSDCTELFFSEKKVFIDRFINMEKLQNAFFRNTALGKC